MNGNNVNSDAVSEKLETAPNEFTAWLTEEFDTHDLKGRRRCWRSWLPNSGN
jgi:hypothetical protein